jgi:tetratricopeptide (TPR) repeat protein
LERFPESAAIIARLAVSYFHNEEIDKCKELLERIAGRRLPGKLADQVNSIVQRMDATYYESSELVEALRLYGQEELEKTASRLQSYLDKNKNDVMAIFHLANINFDMGKYGEAEILYTRALGLQPEFYSANLNLAAVYRMTGNYERAAECCNKVLGANKEHPQAFMALSRLELQRGDLKAGLEYSKMAYDFDNTDMQAAANLCIAYHYNSMYAERDKLYQALRQNDYHDLEALRSVIGKQ